MNAEARRLGLHDTHFDDPERRRRRRQLLERLGSRRADPRRAAQRALPRRSSARASSTCRWAAPTYSKIYVNNNRLLGTYPGANGVKTGYTHKAGPCLVASATRDGVSLIAVVLDSPDMYTDASACSNFGFRLAS